MVALLYNVAVIIIRMPALCWGQNILSDKVDEPEGAGQAILPGPFFGQKKRKVEPDKAEAHLFANTETGENTSQQIVRRKLAGDLA